MSKLEEFYNDYYTSLEKANESSGKKETTYKEGNWQSALERLKRALYEYGYRFETGENPKKVIDESLYEKVGTPGFRSDALINTLVEMDNEYRKNVTGVDISMPTLPSELGLEKKEYVAKSDEELLLEAESALKPQLEKSIQKAEDKLNTTRDKLDFESETALINEGNELDELYQKGAKNLTAHRDDMIFSGLINSTINSEGERQIIENLASENLKIEEKYDRKLTEIKNNLTLAEREYESAIKEYNLEYALDLQAKVNKLKLNEEKRLEEINAYNQKIAEKEEKYKQERLELLQKMRAERQEALFEEMKREQAQESELGIPSEKRLEYTKRKNMAETFYSNFTKEEALVLIAEASDKLKNLLGEEEYLNLIVWNNNR